MSSLHRFDCQNAWRRDKPCSVRVLHWPHLPHSKESNHSFLIQMASHLLWIMWKIVIHGRTSPCLSVIFVICKCLLTLQMESMGLIFKLDYYSFTGLMMMASLISTSWTTSFTTQKAHSKFFLLDNLDHILERQNQHATMLVLSSNPALISPLSHGIMACLPNLSCIHWIKYKNYWTTLVQLLINHSVNQSVKSMTSE